MDITLIKRYTVDSLGDRFFELSSLATITLSAIIGWLLLIPLKENLSVLIIRWVNWLIFITINSEIWRKKHRNCNIF